MPRTGRPDWRTHLILLLIAIIIALIVLLVRADTASAAQDGQVDVLGHVATSQITGDDYQRAVTTERLMILGMLALVGLTFLYLRWRPPPDREGAHDQDTHEHSTDKHREG